MQLYVYIYIVLYPCILLYGFRSSDGFTRFSFTGMQTMRIFRVLMDSIGGDVRDVH